MKIVSLWFFLPSKFSKVCQDHSKQYYSNTKCQTGKKPTIHKRVVIRRTESTSLNKSTELPGGKNWACPRVIWAQCKFGSCLERKFFLFSSKAFSSQKSCLSGSYHRSFLGTEQQDIDACENGNMRPVWEPLSSGLCTSLKRLVHHQTTLIHLRASYSTYL